MAKQTLKSLLGVGGDREQVDLNLDEQVFQAPTVRAGNYQIAPPVYAKTNSLSQLAQSLERYSGPLLRGYANIQNAQAVAMEDASELLSLEELKAYKAGDMEGVLASINDSQRELDSLQRKRLISYLENPNNYARAYKRTGSRVAKALREDILTNMDDYAEDPNFNLQNKADELAKEYGLEGLGAEQFYKEVNNINERTIAQLNILKETKAKDADTVESVSLIAGKLKDGTIQDAEADIAEAFGTRNVAEQEELITGIVTQLAGESIGQAERLITAYREGELVIGTGGVKDEFADSLEDILDKQRLDEVQAAELKIRTTKLAFVEAQNQITAGIALGDIPETVQIPINDEDTLEIDTSNVKSLSDYGEAGIAALSKTELDITSSEKASLATMFDTVKNSENNMRSTRRRNSGVDVAVSQIQEAYTAEIDGENVYPFDDAERIDKISTINAELNKIVDDIYKDPQYKTDDERQIAATAAVNSYKLDKMKTHEDTVKQFEEVARKDKFERAVGAKGPQLNNAYLAIVSNIQRDDDEPEIEGNAIEISEMTQGYAEETQELVNEIYNRTERTEEEVGLNEAELRAARVKEAQKLVATRKAFFSADLSADGKLDGRTNEKQQPENITETQDKLAAKKEDGKIEIIEGESGFQTNKSKAVRLDRLPLKERQITTKRNKTLDLIRNITTPKSKSSFFIMGFDKFRVSGGSTATNEFGVELGDATTIHELNRYKAELAQSGEPFLYDNRKKRYEEGNEELAERAQIEFMIGETTIRAVRDGVTPITIEELEAGRLRNIAFDPLKLDQSAHAIVPFDVINKALQDKASPEQEKLLHDYVDALYDMSQIDEAGRIEVIKSLIQKQVIAYNQLGFQFGTE